MQHHANNPHDDPFADAPPDPEHGNTAAWLRADRARRHQPTAFAEAAATPQPGGARFSVDWIDADREATYPADPGYPNGVAIDVALDAPHACRVELPWPAARVGQWVVVCRECGFAVALETAGRCDDPQSVRMPCRGR